MHALSAAIRLRHLPVKSSNQNDYAAARRARPAAGIGMPPPVGSGSSAPFAPT